MFYICCRVKLSVHHIDVGLHALFSCPFCANIDGVHISRRSFSALEVCGTWENIIFPSNLCLTSATFAGIGNNLTPTAYHLTLHLWNDYMTDSLVDLLQSTLNQRQKLWFPQFQLQGRWLEEGQQSGNRIIGMRNSVQSKFINHVWQSNNFDVIQESTWNLDEFKH